METDKYLNKAIEMARASIYDTAAYLGEWNGYRVYEPDFNDNKEHCIGIPLFILEKDGKLRWTRDGAESFDIMDALYEKEEEEEEE